MALRLLVKKFQRTDTHSLIDDRNDCCKTFCSILKSFYIVRAFHLSLIFVVNTRYTTGFLKCLQIIAL